MGRLLRRRMARIGMLAGMLLCATALADTAPASPPPGTQPAALSANLSAIVADPAHPIAGLSVLAIRAGRVVYEGQFGFRHIAADGATLPVTPDTAFRIASVSKMITTLALMRLVEDGKLRLDDDVGTYLGFSLRNPRFPGRPVTLRQLLTHTASLRDAAGYAWGAEVSLKDVFTPGSKLYGDGAMWAAETGPGDYFTYCNLDWGVIGTVMEKVTGQRFDLLMKALLLDPLAIHGGYNPSAMSPAEAAELATLYRKRTTDTEIWNPAGPWIAQADDYQAGAPAPPAGLASYIPGSNATLFSPTGGLRISAADLGKIMLMLLNEGNYQGRQILQAETVRAMFRRQWQADGRGGNGDTYRDFYLAWGLGNQQFGPGLKTRPDTAAKGAAPGNRVADGADFEAAGHLGDAYGLMSAFILDFRHKNGMVTLIGGTGTDPAAYPGQYSSLSRYEEKVLSTLYRGAISP